MNYLAANISYLRKATGLSQAQVGAGVDAPRNTISNWETGYTEPQIEKIILLSQFFDVTVDQLLNVDLASKEYKANTQQASKPYPASKRKKAVLREAKTAYNVAKPEAAIPADTEDKDEIIKAQQTTITALQVALTLARQQIELLRSKQK